MAGVAKFDRRAVLLSAAREFADRGYEGTSITQLVTATGLLRGSLYGSFGSKSELFRLALDEAVSEDSDRDLVLDLVTVALRERAAHDPDVAQLVRDRLAALDGTGMPASEQIYRRLTTRAGIQPSEL
ncbi:helix-turn-helix transcriptional regulator [Arthrobacter sp. zg-ZUI100]|uniref:TetR/AcrR family transcriptional regulator n=1 Tax=Arthrobacter jiangjiafuii TaxID=2817475 RepID=UPI001AED68AC|nr:TetR/AcrR family transcriptional regulator [Arthrobacter jiangjiafuii]MBP3036600.1 helix-turn-helix transcriptional regulator [Arthrobacter jiangjiafuii]